MKKEELKQLIREAYNEVLQEANNSNINSLYQSINKCITDFDESLSYHDLARLVATILINDYGTHNINPFISELKKNLNLKEATQNIKKVISDKVYRRLGDQLSFVIKTKVYDNKLQDYIGAVTIEDENEVTSIFKKAGYSPEELKYIFTEAGKLNGKELKLDKPVTLTITIEK